MKNHRIEIAALTLLLGVLCYAYYDSNISENEQEIVYNKNIEKITKGKEVRK